MDRFHASDIAWGIVGTIFFIWWLGATIVFAKSQPIDIFNEDDIKKATGKTKSQFQKRLEKMAKDRGYKSPMEN